MPTKKIIPQTKAVVVTTKAGNFIVRTDDGRAVVMDPQLAANVAMQILGDQAPAPANTTKPRWLL